MVAAAVVLAWVLLALAVALVLGRAVRLADHHAPYTDDLIGLPAVLTVADVLGARAAAPSA